MKREAERLEIPDRPIRRAWENGPPEIVLPGDTEITRLRRFSQHDPLSDKSWLIDWQSGVVLDGAANANELLKEWRPDLNRAERRRLLNAFKRAGGGFLKAERGTAFHTHAEHHANDRSYQPPDEYAPAIYAFFNALDELELTIVATERFVVWPEMRLGGTFDMIVENRDGVRFILDLKTGRLYHLSLLFQLYGYARAPFYFEQGEALDGSQDVWTPKPETSTDVAYVAEIDIDAATAKIREVDLSRGAYVYALAEQVEKARELTTWGPALNTARGTKAKVDAVFGETIEVSTVDDQWRVAIRDRITAIVSHDACDTARFSNEWPAGVPTLKSGEPITVSDGEAITELVEWWERELEMPFPKDIPVFVPRPRPPARRPVAPEGSTVPADLVAALNDTARNLTDTGRQWVSAVMKDAERVGRPIHLSGHSGRHTERRLAICTALVAVADYDDNALVRQLVETACDTPCTNDDLGELFASLTVTEADRVAKLAAAIDAGTLTVGWNTDGAPYLTGDVPAALAA